MTFLKVLLVLIAVFWLLSLIRLGASVRYETGTVFLRLVVGPFRITLLPAKEKKKPPKEKKKAKKAAEEPEKQPDEKKKRKLPPVSELLSLAAEAAGRLKRKIRIDELTVHLIWASGDPAETAVGFGRANAAMGMIWGLVENNFHVKKHDLGVAVDFERDKPELYCSAALTMTVGQLVAFGVRFGVKLLVIWSRSGRDSAKNQEAKV